MPNANASGFESPTPDTSRAARASRASRVLRAGAFAGVLGGVTFLLASAHVPCGFAHVFHMPCPGCGSTRAMLALASGDVGGMLHFNPLAPFMTALIVVLALQAFASVLTTGTFARVGDGTVGTVVSRGMLVVALLELVVWFARFGGFLGGPVPV